MPAAVKVLLGLNLAVFALEYLWPEVAMRLFVWLALWPLNSPEVMYYHGYLAQTPSFYPWQVITYGFLHGGFAHLFFNMYALYLFGSVLERIWGWKRFCSYYFLCVFGAAITQLVTTYGGTTATVGASGGVFGLLLAFGIFFPRTRLQLIFPPVALEARWFVLIYGLIELSLGVTNLESGIAHFAHLGGMLFGFPLVWYWKKQFTQRTRGLFDA